MITCAYRSQLQVENVKTDAMLSKGLWM